MIPLRTRRAFAIAFGVVASVAMIGGTLAAGDVRLTNDFGGGYVSAYTLATGNAYTDNTLTECGVARGRQNEPAVEIDPRNANLLIGSSNDYCGVYQPPGSATPSPVGPIWLGYYRSEDGGASFRSSLVPGYPDDTSPYAAQAHVRTASAGDPVIAWDGHGRVFMGSESSDDPAGTKKTFGDVFVAVYDNPGGPGGATINDGKRFVRSEIVNRGSSAPNLLGVFNDKTAIEADRTGGACDGTVYFAWSRFTGNGTNNIYIARSTDHGATWSNPKSLSQVAQDVQFPDISVTANGHVYVTFRQSERKNGQTDADRHREVDRLRRDFRQGHGAPAVPALRRERRLGSGGHAGRQPGRRPLRGGRDRGRRRRAIAAISTPTASPATRSSGVTRRSARPPIRPTPRTSGSTSSTTPANPAARSRPGRRTARSTRASAASRPPISCAMTARPGPRPRRS